MQDTFKVSRHLTFNEGFRYDLPLPYTEIRNRQNLFEPPKQSTVISSAPVGLLHPGDPRAPAGLIPAQKDAFAPRIGLAWEPTGSGRWLVSSGCGILYDPYYNGQGGPVQTPISAPPYLRTAQLMFLGSLSNPFDNGNPFASQFAEPMTLLSLSPRLRLPYTQDWNLNVEKSFGANSLFEAGNVGTKKQNFRALSRTIHPCCFLAKSGWISRTTSISSASTASPTRRATAPIVLSD
jgi:hypothetical protein